uniref:Uncharacterized protein n=1 Tax=Hyaloperonospora arabidopsidis (strain Emoy2) TaxID=559515 RepID=M4BE40_HYAAE
MSIPSGRAKLEGNYKYDRRATAFESNSDSSPLSSFSERTKSISCLSRLGGPKSIGVSGASISRKSGFAKSTIFGSVTVR